MPRFLHVADPHIDSAVRSLRRTGEAEGDTLTRDAFAAAVDLAVEEAVDLMVIAGDLFDGDWRHAGTWQWTKAQLQKLGDHGVPVAFLRGNHDAASDLQVDLRWPENVHEFPTDAAGSKVYEDAGLAVHGRGYAKRETFDNLAAGYPKADGDLFHVGVLHTSLEGDTQHAAYAPAAPSDLMNRGYGYWALGHVHKPTPVADCRRHGVPILFAGNPQGRDVGEAGARGAVLVDVENGQATPRFRPLDKLRWYVETVGAEDCETVDNLTAKVTRHLEDRRTEADGRQAVVRVEVTGPFAGHAEVDRVAGRSVLAEAVEAAAASMGRVRVESLRVSTSPPVDLDRVRREGGLLAEVLAEFDRAIAAAEGEAVPTGGSLFDLEGPADEALLSAVDADLDKHAGVLAGKGLDVAFSGEDRARWLRNARSHLIAELTAS